VVKYQKKKKTPAKAAVGVSGGFAATSEIGQLVPTSKKWGPTKLVTKRHCVRGGCKKNGKQLQRVRADPLKTRSAEQLWTVKRGGMGRFTGKKTASVFRTEVELRKGCSPPQHPALKTLV